jgi:prepilin-type N-terminal cleavage/methylation domain-containing protein
MKNNKQQGYSLVEMSIVLAIIGLLIGITIKGKAIIDSTKDKRAVTEWQDTRAATALFKRKFGAMPGDYNKAQTMIDASLTNGNNNGIIHLYGITLSPNSEAINTWAHLHASGYLKLPYRSNTPGRLSSAVPGADWWMTTDTMAANDDDGYADDNKHYMHLLATIGDDITNAAARDLSMTIHSPAVSQLRADEFDRKYDDSSKSSGEIRYDCNPAITGNNCKMQFYVGG